MSTTWSTKTTAAPIVQRDVEHSAVVGGLSVVVARMSYGSVSVSVLGRLSGRTLVVYDHPSPKLTDAELMARAEELAEELLSLGWAA